MRLDTFRREGILFSFVLTLVSACGGSAVVTQDKPTPSGPELTEAVGGGVVGAAPETAGEVTKSSEAVKLVSSDIAQYFQSIDADPAEPFPIEISDFYLAEDSKITKENLDILEWNLHQDGALLSADDKLIVNGFSAVLKFKSTTACGQLSIDHLVLIFCPGSINVSVGNRADLERPWVKALLAELGRATGELVRVSVRSIDIAIPAQSGEVLVTIQTAVASNAQQNAQQAGAGAESAAAPATSPEGVVFAAESVLSAIRAGATSVAVVVDSSASGTVAGSSTSSGVVSNATSMSLTARQALLAFQNIADPSVRDALWFSTVGKFVFLLGGGSNARLVSIDVATLEQKASSAVAQPTNMPTGITSFSPYKLALLGNKIIMAGVGNHDETVTGAQSYLGIVSMDLSATGELSNLTWVAGKPYAEMSGIDLSGQTGASIYMWPENVGCHDGPPQTCDVYVDMTVTGGDLAWRNSLPDTQIIRVQVNDNSIVQRTDKSTDFIWNTMPPGLVRGVASTLNQVAVLGRVGDNLNVVGQFSLDVGSLSNTNITTQEIQFSNLGANEAVSLGMLYWGSGTTAGQLFFDGTLRTIVRAADFTSDPIDVGEVHVAPVFGKLEVSGSNYNATILARAENFLDTETTLFQLVQGNQVLTVVGKEDNMGDWLRNSLSYPPVSTLIDLYIVKHTLQ